MAITSGSSDAQKQSNPTGMSTLATAPVLAEEVCIQINSTPMNSMRTKNLSMCNVFLMFAAQLSIILGIVNLIRILHQKDLFKANTSIFYAIWLNATVVLAVICLWKRSRRNLTIRLALMTVFHGISLGCFAITPILKQHPLLIHQIVALAVVICLTTALSYELPWSYSAGLNSAVPAACVVQIFWLFDHAQRFNIYPVDVCLAISISAFCCSLICSVHTMVDTSNFLLTFKECEYTALTVYVNVVRLCLIFLLLCVLFFHQKLSFI